MTLQKQERKKNQMKWMEHSNSEIKIELIEAIHEQCIDYVDMYVLWTRSALVHICRICTAPFRTWWEHKIWKKKRL